MFCSSVSAVHAHRPRPARPVLLPERSQSWRVKSLRACVIPAAQASSGGGGGGEGEGAVCVKREERAWDAGGKEGEWAGRGGGSRNETGERQIFEEGETEEGRNYSAKTVRLLDGELHKRQRSGAWRILHAIFSPKDNL